MEVLPHHIKEETCSTRPKYRDGRIPKVVKAYTCAQESKYILVTNIPSIGVHNDLIKLFNVYGSIEENKMLDEYPTDPFTETILLKFEQIQSARIAKIKLDDWNFYGNNLHVFYAPEFETIDDVREKIKERRDSVASKCQRYESMNFGTFEYDLKAKNAYFSRADKHLNKKKQHYNTKKSYSNVKTKEENDQQPFIGPVLPPNWIKETITGDQSYDETVKEIRDKLKRTLPEQVTYSKKRKKILQIDK